MVNTDNISQDDQINGPGWRAAPDPSTPTSNDGRAHMAWRRLAFQQVTQVIGDIDRIAAQPTKDGDGHGFEPLQVAVVLGDLTDPAGRPVAAGWSKLSCCCADPSAPSAPIPTP